MVVSEGLGGNCIYSGELRFRVPQTGEFLKTHKEKPGTTGEQQTAGSESTCDARNSLLNLEASGTGSANENLSTVEMRRL